MSALWRQRSLQLWAGLLAVGVALSVAQQGWLRGLLVIALLAAAYQAWRRQRVPLGAEAAALLAGLPAADYRLPLVLLCGDTAGDPVQRSAEACYWTVPLPSLAAHARQLLAWRPHWAAQVSVMLQLDLSDGASAAAVADTLRSLRQQLAQLRSAGWRLPLLVLCLQPGGTGQGPWFTWAHGQPTPQVRSRLGSGSLAAWQVQAASVTERAARLAAAVKVSEVGHWWAQQVLPVLTAPGHGNPPCPPLACAAVQVGAQGPASAPLPCPLLALLPAARQANWRQASAALWLCSAALLLAFTGAALHNRHLLLAAGDAFAHYQQPGPGQGAALAQLANLAQQLARWQRNGPPLGLGWGLYRGGALRVPLAALLERPAQPGPAAPPLAVQLPSLALFGSGSAQLKPGAHAALVPALVALREQPPGLVLISGHTDASGDPGRNRALSQARAAAVRDWLEQAGGLARHCFALQGLGASQPIASNDSETGRAANRRVSIRLVPQAGGCMPQPVTPGNPTAARFALPSATKE